MNCFRQTWRTVRVPAILGLAHCLFWFGMGAELPFVNQQDSSSASDSKRTQEQTASEAAEASAASTIERMLLTQSERWNAKDIEGFMGSYLKSEKLTFSAGGKTTRGWQATLDRYKEKYPPEKMGKLTFDHLEVELLNDSAALVLGEWHLQFNKKNEQTGKSKADGNFSLVLKKLSNGWKIIHDHSSSLE